MEMEEEGEGKKRNPRNNVDGGENELVGGGNGLKDGGLLLGSPTFEELGSGRVRCVETGHELPAEIVESYGQCNACRLALIDAAVSRKKPPLDMFKPDPLSKSKLICKLTGDTINKTEEHIWKHISGKRFLNKLQQKKAEKLEPVVREKKNFKSSSMSNSGITGVKKDQKKSFGGGDLMERKPLANSSDSDEPNFLMLPVGCRWEFGKGRGRGEFCASSGLGKGQGTSRDGADKEDLCARTKRMSIAVGPSSFASRKKKSKNAASYSNGG